MPTIIADIFAHVKKLQLLAVIYQR